MKLGGSVWHASAAAAGYVATNQLEREVRAALEGVGDAQLGEWLSIGERAVHLRRRLSRREEAKVGPVVDIRGTDEAVRRIARLGRLVDLVPPDVLQQELGT